MTLSISRTLTTGVISRIYEQAELNRRKKTIEFAEKRRGRILTNPTKMTLMKLVEVLATLFALLKITSGKLEYVPCTLIL